MTQNYYYQIHDKIYSNHVTILFHKYYYIFGKIWSKFGSEKKAGSTLFGGWRDYHKIN
jgi:hypothetical protein